MEALPLVTPSDERNGAAGDGGSSEQRYRLSVKFQGREDEDDVWRPVA